MGHQLDLAPFITILWAWPSSQGFYSAKSTPIQAMNTQFLQGNVVGNGIIGFTEVCVDKTHSLALIHWRGHVLTEEDQARWHTHSISVILSRLFPTLLALNCHPATMFSDCLLLMRIKITNLLNFWSFLMTIRKITFYALLSSKENLTVQTEILPAL